MKRIVLVCYHLRADDLGREFPFTKPFTVLDFQHVDDGYDVLIRYEESGDED